MTRPRVVVGIPTYNEREFIETLLEQFLTQDYDVERYEVVIADGGSTDGTQDRVDRMIAARAGALPLLRRIDNPDRVPAGAVNAVLASTDSDILTIVGAHAEVPSDWLRRSVEVLEESGADVAGGVVETRGRTPKGRAIAVAMSSRVGVGGVAFRVGAAAAGPADTVPFGAFRRRTLVELGGADLDLVGAEDDELTLRVRLNGGTVWLDPSIRSAYYCRDSYGALFRQYFQYGRGKAFVARKHRMAPSVRMMVPPAFVAGLALGVITWPIRRLRWLLPATVAAYACVVATGARAAERPTSRRQVGAAIVVMHVAYGLGVWRGLIGRRCATSGEAGGHRPQGSRV